MTTDLNIERKKLKLTGREIDDETLRALMMNMRSWTELAEDFKGELPSAVIAALGSGRPELISATVAETTHPRVAALLTLIQCLMQTNRALQMHAEELAKKTRMLEDTVKGLFRVCRRIDSFANFKHYEGEDDA